MEKMEEIFLRILRERGIEVIEETLESEFIELPLGLMEAKQIGEEYSVYAKGIYEQKEEKLVINGNEAILKFQPKKTLTKITLTIKW